MKISVIIPVYNEEKEILSCLESLGKQTFTDFEIIIVDDGSTDDTVKEIKNLQKIVQSIKLLQRRHEGPALARNLGALKAKGKVLVFVDADMSFDENFLKELTMPIVNGKAKGTFSREEYVGNWNNIWARDWNINQNLDRKRRIPKDYPDREKVFRAILKSEFEKGGGFSKGGYTDDYTLSKKLGYEAEAIPGAKYFHKNPDKLVEVFKQAKWTSKREYKLGIVGTAWTMFKSLLPFSVVIGIYKSAKYKEASFLPFKIIYDIAVIIGIIEYKIFGMGSK